MEFSPPSAAEKLFPKPTERGPSSSGAVKEVSRSNHYPGKILDPGAKIKLQLFPRDEMTRMELEKVRRLIQTYDATCEFFLR